MRAILSFASAAFLYGAEVDSLASGESEVDGAKKCSFYLAKSTIENAGLGVFSGVNLKKGEHIGFGDLSIPIIDIDFHAGGSKSKEDYHWLLDEYGWKASEASPFMEMEAAAVTAFVPGVGSTPNCHFRLKNIAETRNDHDTVGITRTDPGVGAFTPYHNRSTYALAAIKAGSELFVDYGINWFLTREQDMGLVPLSDSYPTATRFMNSYRQLVKKTSKISPSSFEEVMSDLLDMINLFPYHSRPLSAVPKSFSVAKRAFEVGIKQTELEQSIRSLDYLENNGKCLDNIRPDQSSIPHAGRGAFATRFMQKGSYVGIAPLVHVPDRDVLTVFAGKLDPKTGEESRNLSQPTGQQLLLNYCFGHKSSSLLLCPYSSGTSFINHNSKSPNTKITWSDDPTYSNSSWMDEPVSFFDNIWHGGLAFEYIALSDIQPGDEITLDYGPAWEEAWSNHIQRWEPPEGAESYKSPQELSENPLIPIPTYNEDNTLVGDTIDAWCHFSLKSIKNGIHTWQERDMIGGNQHTVQRIIDRTQLTSDQSYVYTLELIVETDDKDHRLHMVKDVPRKALSFFHKKYKSDMFIKGAFRHEMMIPDDLFPAAWKNIL